jgi:ABC-2 type transport system permease protein
MMKNNFTHSFDLTRFMLRRERVISTVWLVLLVLFCVGLVPGLGEVIGDEEQRDGLLQTITDPSMIALMGPLYDSETTGGLYAFMMLLWTMIAVGLMNIFLIVRHTRADEERGRAEVIRSLPAGRLATLNAAMLTAVIVNSALALFTGLGMGVMGVESMNMGGCMLYGVLLGVYGLFCAAVTAVFCQLCVSSRGAVGFSGAVLAFFYIIRGIGDMPNDDGVMEMEALSYLSPMGILQRSEVFAGNYWWPVFTVLLITAAVTALAFALNRVRDLEQGFIPAKPGRGEAKKSLATPFGLSWRLLRNPMIAWTAGIFLLGYSYGMILGTVTEFIEGNDFYGELMIDIPEELLAGFSPEDMENMQAKSYAATINIMIMICSVIPVFIAVLKLRGEEKDGRLEHVLACSVSRVHYLAAYTGIGFAASIAVPFMSALGFYLSGVSVMENPLPFDFFLKNSMVYLPALWVMLGLAVLLVGLVPKAAPVCWAYMGWSLFTLFFGRVIGLPEWASNTTPFGHIPLLIVEDVNWPTLAALTLIAAVLIALGFLFYRKRDMQT